MPAVSDDFALPLAKRQKLVDETVNGPSGSRIFVPYRTLGLISPTTVPFTSIPLGKTTFQITTSVGRNIHTYDLRRGLNVVFLSRPQTPAPITAICAYKDRVLVAWGGTHDSGRGIWFIRRGKLVGELQIPDHYGGCILSLTIFGAWIVGCAENLVEVWKITGEHYTTLSPSFVDNHEPLTGILCTCPTFLNKIFVGRKDGNTEVWNVSTGRLVHTLLPPSPNSGPVTALEPTPAISLLAIAYSDGSITIRDVLEDDVIMTFKQNSPTTSISFRSDGMGAGPDGRDDGIMATSRRDTGDITFWDLNDGGKIKGILRSAHEVSSRNHLGVTKIQFLPGQPILVSTGMDNSLETWIFDGTPLSPVPRQLHIRSGHSAPVTKLLFNPTNSDDADAMGKWLLSAGQDRTLWTFSTRKDGQNSELSQGSVKRKAKQLGTQSRDALEDLRAPEITSIACCMNRDGGMASTTPAKAWSNIKAANAEESNQSGWESIITTHKGDRFARTWSWGRRRAGRWAFETSDKTEATSVAITSCGTFALVGSAGGTLDMFNLQSGIQRQQFPPKASPSQFKQLKLQSFDSGMLTQSSTAHNREITGIAVDNLNEHVISTSLDGTLKVWDFVTGKLVDTVDIGIASTTAMRYNAMSGLASLSCDDFCVRIVDVETRRIIRELWGAGGQIYDHCFSNDGKWIVACSMDSVIRIWDLSTGHLIDAFKTTTTCTSLAFSASGEYLATGHSSQPGIELWSNKSLYMHVRTNEIDETSGIIDLSHLDKSISPGNLLDVEDELDQETVDNGIEAHEEADQLSAELLTLSFVPRNKWVTLLYLDKIKARNKPVEPPKQPEKAPFFLQSAISANPTPKVTTQENTRISRLELSKIEMSKFSNLLSNTTTRSTTANLDALITELASLSPAAADLEIRSLQIEELEPFVRALAWQLRQRKDYELVITWMSCFIRLHSDFIEANSSLQEALADWKQAALEQEKRLSNIVGYCSGVVDFIRSDR